MILFLFISNWSFLHNSWAFTHLFSLCNSAFTSKKFCYVIASFVLSLLAMSKTHIAEMWTLHKKTRMKWYFTIFSLKFSDTFKSIYFQFLWIFFIWIYHFGMRFTSEPFKDTSFLRHNDFWFFTPIFFLFFSFFKVGSQ